MTPRDQFIQQEVGPMLQPGEQVVHQAFMVKQPGLLWQILLIGGLLLFLLTKAYYVVCTDRRLILIRTKMGMFSPKMVNIGVEEIPLIQIAKCSVSGIANNRSMAFHYSDGNKRTLRISPWFKTVTGQGAFFEQIPNLINSGQLHASASAAAAQLPAGQGAPAVAGAPGAPAAGAPALAPGAAVNILGSDGNNYPGKVLQVQNDQVLCEFPGGEQQWVAVTNITAT